MLKNHLFAPSQNVGIPCKILCIFKSTPPFSRAPLHFYEINGFLAKRAVLDQENALLGPKCALPGPLLKTLYKHKLLGGLLGAHNRKSATFHKKAKFSAKCDSPAKILFSAQKVRFAQKGGKPPKTLPFLL